MADAYELSNRKVTVTTDVTPMNGFTVSAARVHEGLSKLTEVRARLILTDKTYDIGRLLGRWMSITVHMDDEQGTEVHHGGHCVEVQEKESRADYRLVEVELRPWLWLLGHKRDNRIYQAQDAIQIIKSIFGDHGFSDYQDSTVENHLSRDYCVQFDESDLDFVSRLMEEEGIYYFFDMSISSKATLRLVDGIGGHQSFSGAGISAGSSSAGSQLASDIPYFPPDSAFGRDGMHIYAFSGASALTPGKVSLNDFDFETPAAELISVSTSKAATFDGSTVPMSTNEFYVVPGHYRRDTSLGGYLASVRMQSLAAERNVLRAETNVVPLRVGNIFRLTEHPVPSYDKKEYLVTEATHYIRGEAYGEGDHADDDLLQDGNFDEASTEGLGRAFRSSIRVIQKSVPFRAPLNTPRPKMAGLQTAMVTGPSGEEIYTDEYARIKVQFHWDREGKSNENSSCWVRCMMPWTGKNWGMISVPRIGQEVVIQFEDGDIDRPICTGMLYNVDTMPPYTLPANMTQTGIVTRSTKEGSTATFNELIFEDKKDAEFVRLQSEKDYTETIKNNATITIGMEKQDPGDLTQTVYHTKTETIKTGDHVFTVEKGNQTIHVETDHTETINGKSTQTIKGDTAQTVSEGDFEQTVSQGNFDQTVSEGDETVTVTSGDYSLKASAGNVSIEAGTSITLKVGNNSIKIDSAGVTVSGATIKITGDASLDASSPSTTVKADANLTLKGGVVMIN